jgi:hypothetical protein
MNKEEDKNKEKVREIQPGLRLPVIGKVHIESFETILEDRNIEILPWDLNDLERKIGNYLLASGEIDKILDLLFPETDDFKNKKIRPIVYGKNIEEAPLVLKLFEVDAHEEKGGENRRQISAWANLMLDLGEFKLDLDSSALKKELSFTCSTYTPGSPQDKDYYSLYAQFAPHAKFAPDKELLSEIWERILGKDTVIVLIDDDNDFGSQCGISEKEKIQPSKKIITKEPKLGTKIWIAPGEQYEKKFVDNCIKTIIDSFKKIEDEKKKLVFVVDLLYKKKHEKTSINRIEGTELIQDIRADSRVSPLIIGFTGGKSPFIINSAARAGADVVIMKERSRGFHGEGHSQTGGYYEVSSRIDSGGLFDVLWAISKNISRQRFLETLQNCLRENLEDLQYDYNRIMEKLFFSIEDESPFWRKYLKEWGRKTDDLLIMSVFQERK